MNAAQNATVADSGRGYNLSPDRKSFLIEHTGRPGWSIEQLARHFGVPMTVVHGWLERDDINRAIVKRKFEGARETIQGAQTTREAEEAEEAPSIEPAPVDPVKLVEPFEPPEETPQPPRVSDQTHAMVARAILESRGEDPSRPIVVTPIEPATPRPAGAPRFPLTVLIEDLDDSLLVALMRKLPASGEWSVLERDLWLDAFHACLALSVRLNGDA